MSERLAGRSPVDPPIIPPPRRFVDRRVSYRRATDRIAHQETVLLARSLDILAADADSETRLAGLLELLAATVGARRAAVLADRPRRRVAVARQTKEDPADAEALGAWLDAWAPRPRSQRAGTPKAQIAIVVSDGRRAWGPSVRPAAPGAPHHFASLPIAGAGAVVLGFDFPDERGPAHLDERLPPQLARHAAVALALVTQQIAADRELDTLRTRDAEQNRFVSTVAHELRTPLTGLSGYLDLIVGERVPDPEDEREFLERSREIVDTMGELVGDLLELSRLESGTLRLDFAQFSLAEVCARVVASLGPIAVARGVELGTSLPAKLRAATGDRRRVEQILTNVTANALKFAPNGSTVELSAWFDGPIAVVAVRDEGPGIGAGDRARIFERFFRLAGHERVTGTGLGLPIARDLARAMGGDLGVAAVLGSGSTFVLVLPGPAGAAPEAVAAELEGLVAAEEVRLEERAVLRAIVDSAHSDEHPVLLRPKSSRTASSSDEPKASASSDVDRESTEAARAAIRRSRLRAIDGLAPTGPKRTPA